MMVFKSKKGQSALEFLMTYGWAFLVALVVIGGLAYFGVLDPLSWLPSRCKFGAGEIACDAYRVEVNRASDDGTPANDGIITLKVMNSIGKSVLISNVTAYTDQLNEICSGGLIDAQPVGSNDDYLIEDELSGGATPEVWLEGKPLIIQLEDCEFGDEAVQADKKQRFYVDITYYPKLDGVAFSKTLRGEVFVQTEK